MPRRRWFFQVVRDMLAVESGTKTDFMYAGRINSQQLTRYLDFLLSNGLIVQSDSRSNPSTYTITPRGCEALHKLQEIIDMLGVDETNGV